MVRTQVVDAHFQAASPEAISSIGLLSSASSNNGTCRFMFLDWLKKPTWMSPGRAQGIDERLRRRLVEEPQRVGRRGGPGISHGQIHPVRVAAHVLVPREVARAHAPFVAVLAALVCAAEMLTMRTAVASSSSRGRAAFIFLYFFCAGVVVDGLGLARRWRAARFTLAAVLLLAYLAEALRGARVPWQRFAVSSDNNAKSRRRDAQGTVFMALESGFRLSCR